MTETFFDEIPADEKGTRTLPRPVHERWKPLRSGLLNIFKFDNEEFLFEDGRLLLRGNNGAGKSRVLALQLPFLLDGEMASHRVEPDADQAKRMEWNLLMNQHENRLGYTWIEFGRRDAAGEEHFVTLGCGMHARKGTGISPGGRWYFVTSERVGGTFSLMSDNRVPLNRERLEAALGEENVYRSAREYRAAVDAALFHLGTRYEPLIELLLQLRKPQIMRDFKADDLSRLLSEALPPLSPRLIENVSVSFRSLETDRQQLVELTETLGSVETFLASYQHHVRVAVRRRAAEVRASHSRLEIAQRELRRLATCLEENDNALTTAQKSVTQIDEALTAARETERTLLASPEMKSAEALRQASELRDERRRQAVEDAAVAKRAEETHARHRSELESAVAILSKKSAAVEAGHELLLGVWTAASMPAEGMPSADVPAATQVPIARKKFDKAVMERTQQMGLLRERNAAIESMGRQREREETRFEQRREDVVRCEEEEQRRRIERCRVLEELVRRLCEWEAGLEELPIVKGEDWLVLLDGWAEEEPVPTVQRLELAYDNASQIFANQRSECARAFAEQESLRKDADASLKSLKEGRQVEPPVPHTRADGIREGRLGAPLWKVCEFRDDVATEARTGYESALEASGLLDAWVTSDGELVHASTHDVFILPVNDSPATGLHAVLRVAIDPADVAASGLAPKRVEQILRCIGSSENGGATWVNSDGRWQHGLLHGAWMKPEAEYIGHAARENARRRQITLLEATLTQIDKAIVRIRQEQEVIGKRVLKLQTEREQLPSAEPLRRVMHALELAVTASGSARNRLEEVDRALAKAREAEQAARATRDRDATDLGLERWKEPAALRELEGLLADLREKAAALWPAWDAWLVACVARDAAIEREERARESFQNADARSRETSHLAAAAAAHFEALRASVGATADQVLTRLGELRDELRNLDAAEKRERKQVEDLRVEQATIQANERHAETERAAHESAREVATRRLQEMAEKRLLEEAGHDLQPERVELAPTVAVELARRIEQVLATVAADDEVWKRVQAGVQQQFSDLNDQLGMRGYHPRAEMVGDGIFSVTCAFHGQTRTMTALRQSLMDELRNRQEMFTAREREIIENHLIGEVATELQSLIRAGEEWLRTVNDELQLRPTSSGIRLRFVWEVNAEAANGLDAARQQLLKMTAAWSPAERESIGRFLQDRINGERAADETGTLEDHLRRALDYRAWHRFGIMRFQDGQWKKLTKQTYGTGSGGEKALTLTLPQFAAAAAHYRSAAPFAPRLILLDEVFIGIDKPTRARLMGLLNSFDLDFVMTSELEWGCYSTLPALAISQLASTPDSPAVLVTRWTWNGNKLLRQSDGNGA